MNLKTFLFTAIYLALPASTLCAQESAPQPPTNAPPQPPNAPQGLPRSRDGGPQRPDFQRRPDGQRPDGQRGAGPGEMRRMGPSLFDMLDTNHDGVIDAEEMKNAPEVLKKLDRRGDGRITRDEFFPQFDGRMMQRGPQMGQPGPQWNQGRAEPGPQNQGAQPGRDGGPQAGPQGEHRHGPMNSQPGPGFAQNGPQGPWMHHHQYDGQFGPQPGPGFAQNGPQFGPQGPWMHHHHRDGQYGPQPGRGFAQNGPQFGPQGPWMHHHHRDGQYGPQPGRGFAQNGPQFGPQGPWMHHHHRDGQYGPQPGRGFAQNGPQFGPQMHHGPQPWMQHGPGFNRGPQGPYAMWPGMDGFRPGWRGSGSPDFRRFSHEPQWQGGREEFRAPSRGPEPGGQFPHPDGRRFDQGGMNQPPGPGGPPPDNRNPAGHGPQHHRFGPPFSGNFEQSEDGAAGPQGDVESQPNTPAPDGFGSSAPPPPARPGDVI